jgi:outer membrane protein assembly factor BamC
MHFLSLLRRLPRPALAAAIVAAAAAVLLSGCESTFNMGKKIDYKSAGSAPALEVPPDLTTPTYDDRYQSTTASGAVAARAPAASAGWSSRRARRPPGRR